MTRPGEIDAQAHRVSQLRDRYQPDDRYAAKEYIDALIALFVLYREDARAQDAVRTVEDALGVIRESGVRADETAVLRLEIAELEVTDGEPARARRALHHAREEAARLTDAKFRSWFEQRERALLELLDARAAEATPGDATVETWRHPVFGDGTVEQRTDDVLHLRFADGTLRRIHARYLQRIQ